jgi:exocyst complex component 2
MALDIVKQYISLLSEFFMFSDAAIVTSPSLGSSPTPPMLPKDSNTLTTMHHLMKILGDIQDTVTEITGMEISSEASSSVKGLLESARWKFDDILVHAWLRGMRNGVVISLNQIADMLEPRCKYILPS